MRYEHDPRITSGRSTSEPPSAKGDCSRPIAQWRRGFLDSVDHEVPLELEVHIVVDNFEHPQDPRSREVTAT
jgi:hypothetical protein